MKGKANLRSYIRITFVFSVLLCIFSLNNTIAYSQTIKSNTSVQMFSSSSGSHASNDLIKTNATESVSNTLIVKLIADNLEDRLQKAGAVLNITSKLPQVRNTSFAYLLNQTLSTLHGIPQNADIEKRQIAQNILSSYRDFQLILFILPNGDVYFDEPYSRQLALTTTNLAFRDYFQGAIRTNDTYLGNVITSTASGQRVAMIAVPVYSLKDNSTVAGVWVGGIDFDILNNELQSLNLTATSERVVYVDHDGNKIADSDENNTNMQESFANLTSFKNAIDGQSGSAIETIDDTKKMIVTYQPVNAFHNTWAVLLMQPVPPHEQESSVTVTLDGTDYEIISKSATSKITEASVEPDQEYTAKFDKAGEIELTLPRAVFSEVTAVKLGEQEVAHKVVNEDDSTITISFAVPGDNMTVVIVPEFQIVAGLLVASFSGIIAFRRLGKCRDTFWL